MTTMHDMDALALRIKVREYLDLEHKLFRTSVPMTEQQFDSACNHFEEMRGELYRLAGAEPPE